MLHIDITAYRVVYTVEIVEIHVKPQCAFPDEIGHDQCVCTAVGVILDVSLKQQLFSNFGNS